MTPEPQIGEPSSRQLLNEHLKIAMDVYKHHFDMIFRFNALYLAAVGAMAGYLFGPAADAGRRSGLTVMIAAASVIGAGGNFLAIRFAADFRRYSQNMSEQLGIEPFPSSAMRISWLMFGAAILIFIAGVWMFLDAKP